MYRALWAMGVHTCLTGEPSALPSDPDPAIIKGATLWKIMVDRIDDGGRR